MRGKYSDLKGENVIVVGTGGIGGAIVKDFLYQGSRVFALDKSPAVLSGLGSNTRLRKYAVDVIDHRFFQRILEDIGNNHRPIRSFVYTAGIGRPTSVDGFQDGLPDRLFCLNALGFVYGVKYVLPYLERGSSITAISSINAYRPEHGMAVYDSTKAALLQYVRTAAADLGKKGIRVNAAAPGYIRTPQTIKELANADSRKRIEENTVLGRIGEPADVSAVVVALASDDFQFVTGSCIEISGGLALAQYPPIEKQINK